jgi:hypothetical protein
MSPYFPYRFKLRKVKAQLDNGEKVQYNDVKLKRKHFKKYLILSALFGLYMVNVVKYSRYWYFGAFVPALLIKVTDLRYLNYTEIENFYKYVDERRKGEHLEKLNSNNVTKSLAGADNNLVLELKNDLLGTNKTVYDVTNDIDAIYLKAAGDLLHK